MCRRMCSCALVRLGIECIDVFVLSQANRSAVDGCSIMFVLMLRIVIKEEEVFGSVY